MDAVLRGLSHVLLFQTWVIVLYGCSVVWIITCVAIPNMDCSSYRPLLVN